MAESWTFPDCRYKENLSPSLNLLLHDVKKPPSAFMAAVDNWGGCDRQEGQWDPHIVFTKQCSKQYKEVQWELSESLQSSNDRHKKTSKILLKPKITLGPESKNRQWHPADHRMWPVSRKSKENGFQVGRIVTQPVPPGSALVYLFYLID